MEKWKLGISKNHIYHKKMKKTITIEEETWKKLTLLKLKKNFSTMDQVIIRIINLIKLHKMEDELDGK